MVAIRFSSNFTNLRIDQETIIWLLVSKKRWTFAQTAQESEGITIVFCRPEVSSFDPIDPFYIKMIKLTFWEFAEIFVWGPFKDFMCGVFVSSNSFWKSCLNAVIQFKRLL